VKEDEESPQEAEARLDEEEKQVAVPRKGLAELLVEKYPEQIGRAIENLSGLIAWFPRAQARSRFWITGIFVFLLLALVVTLGVLTWQGKIGAEALIFFTGALTGYIFAFLHKYLGLVG